MASVEFEAKPFAGSNIKDVVSECLLVARSLKTNVKFKFNDKEFLATPTSNFNDLIDQYWNDEKESR